MVFFGDLDLVEWRDFPKGLRVLLLDEDGNSAAETKSKLEAMDYVVFLYFNEKDALDAISTKNESFHVAIVEVTTANSHGSLRFLEMAKDLPTIAISNFHCLSTMMKCIALGAAEFLQKPLSEDKLRNIWQHVVHKAFNAGGNVLSKSLEPIKEKVVSMLQVQTDTTIPQIEMQEENDKFPAPSTPQSIKGRSLTDKENSEESKDLIDAKKISHSNSKSVDNTINNLINVVSNSSKEIMNSKHAEVAAEEEVTSDIGSKTDECSSIKESCKPDMHNGDNIKSKMDDQKQIKSSLANKCNRRKMKVDWTPELHKRFVKAVEQLGIDQAIPSKILELMKVEGLTRHNIASHLQKYRMHRRHILPKDDDRRWPAHTNSVRTSYLQKPLMPIPPYHSNCVLPPNHIYPFWGPPSYYVNGAHTWGPTGFPTWHPPQGSWLRMIPPGIHADAWGCPVVPPYTQSSIPSQNHTLSNGFDGGGGTNWVPRNSYDFSLAEEEIDKIVKEAMSKPWLPLPLGLKPPSIDSVLTELQRQGIRTIPPTTTRHT